MIKKKPITIIQNIIKWGIYISIISVILFITLNNIASFIIIKDGSKNIILKNKEINNEKVDIDELSKKNKRLKKSLSSLFPKGNYIVVDTSKNIIYLKNGEKILHQAIVSTGSGKFLIDPQNQDRKWIFDTPRGELKVKTKKVKPLWVKPDWAFIEEGIEIPNDYNDRVEAGVLGEYALGIGNGYFIHGTLYTRLLGKSVTHGCIRLDDNDLKIIYKAANIGTPVYIF